MHKTCFVGFLRETKILVSAQENAKLSDRSMTAHFIKMSVNGRFSLFIYNKPIGALLLQQFL